MDNPRPATITPFSLIEWRNAASLNITPKFQRRGVWNLSQRSYFIDTLLQEMPCPPVYLRDVYSVKEKKVIHEVIDGQQRMRAVLDFIDGDYAISKSLGVPYAGKKFSDLTSKQQVGIMKYTFHCETFHDISDRDVFEVFRRMNTYASPLTKQELRHGNYFGHFSQSCHVLALEYLEFWRKYKVLSEQKITRMGEVLFTSALLISQIDGLQDKNDSIDTFYADYDDNFPAKRKHEKDFRNTMDEVIDLFRDSLAESQFRKPPFFYSLFGAVFHRTIGMSKLTLVTPRKKLTIKDRNGLIRAVDALSKVITVARSQQQLGHNAGNTKGTARKSASVYPAKFDDFAAACLSQTDNIRPRTVRLMTLYREAFG